MQGGVFEQPPGHLVTDGDLLQFPGRQQTGDLVPPGLPGHGRTAWSRTGTTGRRVTSAWKLSDPSCHH